MLLWNTISWKRARTQKQNVTLRFELLLKSCTENTSLDFQLKQCNWVICIRIRMQNDLGINVNFKRKRHFYLFLIFGWYFIANFSIQIFLKNRMLYPKMYSYIEFISVIIYRSNTIITRSRNVINMSYFCSLLILFTVLLLLLYHLSHFNLCLYVFFFFKYLLKSRKCVHHTNR